LILKDKKRRKKFEKSNRRILLNSIDSRNPGSSLSAFEVGVKDLAVFEEKRKVRSELIEIRSRLTPQFINKNSKKANEHLLGLSNFRKAQRVGLYFPIRNEVRTEGIFEKAREYGKELYFPRVVNALLCFHKVDGLGELRPGKFGVPEPSRHSAEIHVKDLDMIIVPGVAFDLRGRRLGYGKGFYDRTLADVSREKVVGLAYGFQIVSFIPAESEDKSVGVLITENGIIIGQGGGQL
jgi:5-formyltetrahydrofolate cyclo-ligase